MSGVLAKNRMAISIKFVFIIDKVIYLENLDREIYGESMLVYLQLETHFKYLPGDILCSYLLMRI